MIATDSPPPFRCSFVAMATSSPTGFALPARSALALQPLLGGPRWTAARPCSHLFVGSTGPYRDSSRSARAARPAVCTACGAAFPWARPAEPPSDDPVAKLERLLRRLPQWSGNSVDAARRSSSATAMTSTTWCDALPIEFDDVRPQAHLARYALETGLLSPRRRGNHRGHPPGAAHRRGGDDEAARDRCGVLPRVRVGDTDL